MHVKGRGLVLPPPQLWRIVNLLVVHSHSKNGDFVMTVPDIRTPGAKPFRARAITTSNKILLQRGCKSFGSSDRTGVGGCGSQSGSNSAVSVWWEEGENTG